MAYMIFGGTVTGSVGYGLKALSLSAALMLLLGACSAPVIPQAQPTHSEIAVSSSATASTSATLTPEEAKSVAPTKPAPTVTKSSKPAQSTCGPKLTPSALTKLATKLPAPKISTGEIMDWKWDADSADPSTYDECAALSWITFPIEGATGSSPYIIALFHEGKYLGVATRTTFGFFPQVERIDDARLQVTYAYAKNGEANAGASGRAVSTYSWDKNAGSVKHRGDFPPGYTQ